MIELDLNGEYRHKLDAKGRLSLPSDFRKQLPLDLKITESPSDDGLYVFTVEQYQEWLDALFEDEGGYNARDKKHIKLRKLINARTRNVEIDGSGRIGIIAEMREKAGLKKDVVIVGDTDHFEIWDAKRWDQYKEDDDELFLASFFA